MSRTFLPAFAALVVACGSSESTSSDAGDAGDAAMTGDSANDTPVCNYPPTNNDPRCPASYSYSYGGQACPQVGLTCAYPGAGDGMSNGCFATAMLFCHGDGGVTDLDGGGDAGSGTWTGAQ